MQYAARGIAAAVVFACCFVAARAADEQLAPGASGKVYGEWRIQIKPDQGAAYDQLIEQEGLPLFRAAGGRMVGWWKTLIGNLYEHVTIWEYDDMAAFEKAIGYLGPNPKFAAFVAKRDPLLAGEENRFLRLAPQAVVPELHEPAKFVIHEIHRVPLGKQQDYQTWLTGTGLPLLQKHGFRPVGPWRTSVGQWNEITFLFRFESLAEREQLIAKFMATDDGRNYARRVSEFADEVTTRMLMPAAFAKPPATTTAQRTGELEPSTVLRHLERVAPRVWAAGFDDQHQSANCGFVATSTGATLIDLPRGVTTGDFVAEVERLTGRKPDRLLLTHAVAADLAAAKELAAAGITEIVASPQTARALGDEALSDRSLPLRIVEQSLEVGDREVAIRFTATDGTAAPGCAVVEMPGEGVLFGGPLIVHGPRVRVVGSETAEWIDRLKEFERNAYDRVVPGYGTWKDQGLIVRQRRFLEELRSQVGYAIALGRPPEVLPQQVRISPDFEVWMPYDTPIAEDLLYVYRELTAPIAPFNGREPSPDDRTVHALVLIGDGPHEPQHLERGLRPIFEGTGIFPHFTVDVKALSAENLARVRLLVVLRDGLMRPADDPQTHYIWMTQEQQQAVVEFVERGGGFLNLHNSLGLYPADGPYLQLARGKYIGHGPLERFRVEPVVADHPITRGVPPFSIADEQHTPVVDLSRASTVVPQHFSTAGSRAWQAGCMSRAGDGCAIWRMATRATRSSIRHINA
ncbi:MAG: NIPSNAP family protein [Planctomycetaceae bacterium]